jgi:adenosylcobinamide-phosphate synthase
MLLAAASLLIEAAFGYPDWLYRRIGHPVTWIGWLIARLDVGLNRDDDAPSWRRAAGVVALAIVLAAVIAPCAAIQLGPIVVTAILASTLLAQRSLWDHVRRVETALRDESLDAARIAVSHIVGRNPAVLDRAGVARAAIESLAENFSDGVVAPAFWLAVLGLPGIAAYKAINTADSMIGHRSSRHAAFGWAAARLDDVVNLPASRLAALWLVAAALVRTGADPGAAMRAVWRDARHHRSPNAGWPEAAMLVALSVLLSARF